MNKLSLLAASLLIANIPLVSANEICSREDMIVAESVQYFLESWNKYFESYRLFGRCSDGVVSEAFTDTATSLLSEKWNKLNELNVLIKRNPEFLGFVLEHIGGGRRGNLPLLERVSFYANKRCPEKLDGLCLIILKTTQEAMK